MRYFLDSHAARLDKKGRVSFPALFRQVLEQFDNRSFYLRSHHFEECIEGLCEPALEADQAYLATLPAYSEEHELMSMALLGDTTPLTHDAEGRFSLPAKHQTHARIEEALVFVGSGLKFQIWEPALYEKRKAESLAMLRNRRPSLARGTPA